MRRALRIGAGFALALLIVTCTDKDVTGPLKRATATFDVRALQGAGLPGEPDIPLDSIRVTFQDPATSTPALDSIIRTRGDTIAGDSLVLKLAVELLHTPETFIFTLQTYGANVVYYQAVDTLTLTAGSTAPPPPLLARYVGPGVGATSVSIGPRDTTVVGGRGITLRAVVDSDITPLAGVPVGYRLSDSTRGFVNGGFGVPQIFTGASNVRDSVWIVGETPTHLRDSTRIHIIPPPTQLLKVAGDSQGGTPSIVLSSPLTVQVKDALGAPFAGETVTWVVALGGANLSASTTQTDSLGNTSITVTPTATGTLHVTASAAGLAGSPITFTATISSVAPANIAITAGNTQTDTVGKTLPIQLAVKVSNASFAPLANVQVAWSALTGGGVATPDTSATDTAGVARTTYRLGGTSGLQSVRALVAGTGVSTNFSLTGVAGAARRIAVVSGNNQNDTANRTLPLPLIVVTRDTFNNAVVGARVAWSAITGAGTATPDTSTSDTAGHAQTSYKLGLTVGPDSIRAALVGDTAHVTFVATAVSGAISQVIVAPKVDTLPKGDSLQYTATLKDSAGNVTSGTVAWTSTNPTVATVTAAGLAHLVAAGTANIVASAGGHADTAALFVRGLTSIAISPSDTVVTAVGDSLLLTAHGVDNFGTTVGGLVIRFTSASPSIASVNAITGRVHISGAGNAVLLAKDSLSGVQGAATVHVNQIVFSVTNAPPDSVEVGVGGHAQITAKALDRHGFTIAGKTFAWITRNPLIATVNVAGLVTGDSLGQTFAVDTLADSAGVFRDSTLVSVVAVPPALLQWAFDTISIGNGGNVSVGISLTRPNGSPLTVRITSSDTTLVKPSSPTVTFPIGTPGASVIINGLAATTTTPVKLVATDTTGTYLPDTLNVVVISTIEFREIGQFSRQTNFYANQNETHQAQVFLSDPAPAGGIGVTFVYGKGGIAAVTPSPAVIPGGQLAANITIQGIGVGTDSIIPTSGGFVGKASTVVVALDSLQLGIPYPYTGVLGLGQSFQPYAAITYGMDHQLVFAATSATGITTPQSPDTMPVNGTYRYFTVTAHALGLDTVTISAPGWRTTRAPLIVTTPKLQASVTTGMIAGQPTLGYYYAYTEDSTAYQHPVIDTVVVTTISRNPLAVVVDSPTVRVLPGSSSASIYGLRALPTAGGDSAWIVMTAPGYRPDSMMVRVSKPTMSLNISYPYDGRVAVNTKFTNAAYVQIPYVRPDTFWVVFANTRKGVVGAPDSVRILPGATYNYFDVQGDTLFGIDTMTVSRATGYVVTTPTIVWAVDSLHAYPGTYPCCLVTISPPQITYAYVRDAVNSQVRPLINPMRVTLTSSKPAEFTLDSAQVTIPAGQYISNYDTIRVVSSDTAGGRILSSAIGSTADSSGLIRVTPTPLTIQLSYPYSTARGLRGPINSYVTLPANAPSQVKIAITHSNHAIDSLVPDTVVINAGQSGSYQSGGYFRMYGLDSAGTDTIRATAPGFVTATYPGVTAYPARLALSGIGTNHLTTEAPYRVYTYLENAGYNASENPTTPVTYTFVSTDPNVIQVDSGASTNASFDTATSIVDSTVSYGITRIRFAGSGSAFLKVFANGFRKDSIGPITVTGPALHLAYTNLTVGVGQTFQNQYVYVDNPITGSPLVVHLAKSDSTLAPASQAFLLDRDSVIIPVGATGSYSSGATGYVNVTGNTIATAQLIARASGYGQVTTTVAVGQPQLSAPTNLSMYVGQQPYVTTVSTLDQNNQSRVVAAPLTVTDSSTDSTVAKAVPPTVIVPALTYYAYDSIRAVSKGAVSIVYRAAGYKSDTTVVAVDTATLTLQGNTGVNGLGPNQVATNNLYVQLPYTSDSALVVALNSDNGAVATVPATVTIPAGNSYMYIPVTGVSFGTANITATAPHSHPSTAASIRVSKPRLVTSFTTTANAGQKNTLTVYSQDSVGNYRSVTAPLSVTIISSDPTHTTFDSSTITIPAGTYYVQTAVAFDTAGTYTLTATNAGYTSGVTSTITATGALVIMQASLTFSAPTITIPVGTYVTWRNTSSGIQHSATSDTNVSPAFNTGSLSTGQSSSLYFGTAGTYYYHCQFHGVSGNGTAPGTGMVGTIIVQ